jgi:hypothetical protein
MIPLLEVWEQAVQLLDWGAQISVYAPNESPGAKYDRSETNLMNSIFLENKIENKRSVIKGFHRTVAVTQIARATQSPHGSRSLKDTRCHHRIAANCRSVMTSDQTVGSSSLSERAE